MPYREGREVFMAFCKYNTDYIQDRYTIIDNMFIAEFLPFAPDNAVKVYTYGMYLCSNPHDEDNTIEGMSAVLSLTPDEILEAYRYWEEQGLVEIKDGSLSSIKYLPVKSYMTAPKKYKPEKYADFNKQLQVMFSSRMITPNEYNEYYGVIESCHIQPEAMLMIIQYCINLKGGDIRYPYVLAVAKDWAKNGIRTFEDVEAKIKEHELNDENIIKISRELGLATRGGLEEREYYLKWTKSWGFDLSGILFAASQCKKKGGFKKLDSRLDEYYRLGIYTSQDMEQHKKNKDKLYNLAGEVNKIIGLYYESLDYIVESYISSWMQRGYDEQAILTIAKYCQVSSIRTLEGVNGAITRFYKMGLLTTEAINQYLDMLIQGDNAIASLLETTGMLRGVTTQDREYYNTWTNIWGFDSELIDYVAKLSVGKAQPFAYINRILASFKSKGIYTVEEANKQDIKADAPKKKEKVPYLEHNYSKKELEAFFSDINDFDNIEV